jgi:CRISPR/Cas system-associated exonuclease Cas4 (RecB family)
MEKISHSEACTYWSCQKKWKLRYKDGIVISTPHLEFGSIAHKALETREIPDEILYPELKEMFNITSWKEYFEHIFKELDSKFKDYDIVGKEIKITHDKVVGMIDLVLKHKTDGTILLLDYKFKANPMSYEDLQLDEQLKIYAKLYASEFWEDINNIYVGYVNIPKTQLTKPKVLKNGSLSKDKSQNTTRELYLEAIAEQGLKKSDYADILLDLESKEYITTVISSVDENEVSKIFTNLHNTIDSINAGFILETMSSHVCKNCEYKQFCKK